MTRRGLLKASGAVLKAAAAVATLSAPAIAAPGQGPKTLLVAGQSLAVAWKSPEVQAAFRAEAGDDWNVVVAAKGGTSALPWGNGLRAWTAPHAEIGPVLAMAMQTVQAMPAPPAVLLWSQGQADGAVFEGCGLSPEEFTAAYVRAVLRILMTLRKTAAGSRWRDIPVLVQMIGWRRDPETGAVYEPPGYALVRLAQTMLVAEYGRSHNLHMGPVQTPWDELYDEVHPVTKTYCRFAGDAGKSARELVE